MSTGHTDRTAFVYNLNTPLNEKIELKLIHTYLVHPILLKVKAFAFTDANTISNLTKPQHEVIFLILVVGFQLKFA